MTIRQNWVDTRRCSPFTVRCRFVPFVLLAMVGSATLSLAAVFDLAGVAHADGPGRARIGAGVTAHGVDVGHSVAREISGDSPPSGGALPRDVSRRDRLSSRLAFKQLADVTTDIAPPDGDLPDDVAVGWTGPLERIEFAGGPSGDEAEYPIEVASPDFWHHPLYFEEYALERYGRSHGLLQPLASAAHFFGTFPVLPYKLAFERPHACVRTAGPYLPGECGPTKPFLPPFRAGPALVEAGVVTSLVFLIP